MKQKRLEAASMKSLGRLVRYMLHNLSLIHISNSYKARASAKAVSACRACSSAAW